MESHGNRKIEENPVLTAAELRMRTVRELTVIARDLRIQGWHDMRKEALIQAILGSSSPAERGVRQERDRSTQEDGKLEKSEKKSERKGRAIKAEKTEGPESKKTEKPDDSVGSKNLERLEKTGLIEITEGSRAIGDLEITGESEKIDRANPSEQSGKERSGEVENGATGNTNVPKSKTARKKRGDAVDVQKSVSEEESASEKEKSSLRRSHSKAAHSQQVKAEAPDANTIPPASAVPSTVSPQPPQSPQVTIRVRSYSQSTEPAAQTDYRVISGDNLDKTSPLNDEGKAISPRAPLEKSTPRGPSEENSSPQSLKGKRVSTSDASVSVEPLVGTPDGVETGVAGVTAAGEPRGGRAVGGSGEFPTDIPSAIRPLVPAHSAHSARTSRSPIASTTSTGDRARTTNSAVASSQTTGAEPVHVRKFHRLQASLSRSRDLATGAEDATSDQLFLRTSGAFWLEASWTIRRVTVERARAALAHLWHESRPVLRLSEIVGDGTNTTVRRMVTTVEIQGGVNRWYLNVDEPPRTFQVEVGYLDPGNRFIGLVKSNLITTSPDAESPVPGRSAAQRAAEEEDLNTSGVGSFEDRLRRSLGPGLRQPFTWTPGRFLYGESEGPDYQGFHFEVDAALVVYGATDPGVRLSVRGNPVRIQTDGTFMMRFSLPNRRQVIPIVARSLDGLEQRTVIIAVERNTKVMEPILCDPGDSNE